MSGNNVIGKENNDIAPNKSMMIDTTVDKTGLSINLFIMLIGLCYCEAEERIVPTTHTALFRFNFKYYIGLAFNKLSSDIGCGTITAPSLNLSRPV